MKTITAEVVKLVCNDVGTLATLHENDYSWSRETCL